MEILRFKKDEFNLEGFMHYYNDNIEELTFEYPRYVSRICLIDKDYMDVITFDEDYENIDSEKEYANILTSGEYDLHFVVGKTYENAEKIELLDGHKYSLNHYSDDIYEDDYAIRDIGDMSLNMDNLMGYARLHLPKLFYLNMKKILTRLQFILLILNMEEKFLNRE